MSDDLKTETVPGYTLRANEAAIVVAADGEAALLIPKPHLQDIAMNLDSLPEAFAMLAALYLMIMDKPEILAQAMEYVANKQKTNEQAEAVKERGLSIVH